MGTLSGRVLEAEEVIGHLRRSSHLTGSVQTQHQQVHHQPIVLHDERGKLQATDDTVRVCVVHVLLGENTYLKIKQGSERKLLI